MFNYHGFIAFIIIRKIPKYLYQTYHLKVKRNYIINVMILIFPSPTSLT